MNYVGIDIHKKYSVLCAQDETGRKPKQAGGAALEYIGKDGLIIRYGGAQVPGSYPAI